MTAPTDSARVKTEMDAVACIAAAAAPLWAATHPAHRAAALVAVADALEKSKTELVAIAMQETGLTETRLTTELTRTAVQLRLFAETVVDGGYLDVRIDPLDPDFVLGPRPDLRRYLVALGPVVNFAASNFPFSFSVAGGDTAAALAAGCPVVVKAHSGHPLLSACTGKIVATALESAGAPVGTLQVIYGQSEGVAMLKHPAIAAGSFTGSIRVGRFLSTIAASRPVPIPFFGELGSVNPVFVTAAAIAERADAIADGFVASVVGSAGQLCTKPGFLFVPSVRALEEQMALAAIAVPEQRLLNPSIAEGYRARRDAILRVSAVSVISEGALRIDEDGQGWATPTLVSIAAADLVRERDQLLDEAFGPLSVVVEYSDEDNLMSLAAELFDGNLTGTVHLAEHENTPALRGLIGWLTDHVGRVLFGGWPTGVAVTPAMQHGGPWPATTTDSSTSVGTAAISRFLRPVSYQNAPQALLPEPLQDENPWGVLQSFSTAGESRSWGRAQG